MSRIFSLCTAFPCFFFLIQDAHGFVAKRQPMRSNNNNNDHHPLASVTPHPHMRATIKNETAAATVVLPPDIVHHHHPLPETTTPRHQDRIVFGTAALGKATDPFALLDAAYAQGLRRFDLARTYSGGHSERIFGAWMDDRNIARGSIDIITKGGMGHDKYGTPNRPLLTRDGLQEEVTASLQALRTDHVDMYMFHRDDLRMSVKQFVLWGNDLVRCGQAKTWGVSNWSFERFRDAYELAMTLGLEPPRANSPQFSLAIPRCEVWPTTQSISGPQYVEQIQWYEERNIELLCWEVLAKGFMAKPTLWNEQSVDPSSLYAPVEIGSDAWRLQRIQRAYCYDQNYYCRRLAVQLARQRGLTLSQIAILYILSMGKNIHVIFGSNSLNHMEDVLSLPMRDLDDAAKLLLSSVSTTASHHPLA